jgi:hypothetical protein
MDTPASRTVPPGEAIPPAVPDPGAAGEAAGPAPRYCTRHPQRETLVACGRCERPFCPECLIYTPAGQRCYECAGVRRDFAQRAAAARWLQATATVVIGAAIASAVGFFGLFIAAFTGSIAGQALSPLVNRRTRGIVYVLGLALLLAAALVGWSLVTSLRLQGATGGQAPFLLIFITVSLAVLQNWVYWVFVCIAGAVAYQRMR